MSIPASFKFDLSLPGNGNHFLRPTRIFTDHNFHEVYVCDPGNARVLIFNEQGVFQYEFSVAEYIGSPLDVAVSSDGYIVVLGTTRRGVQLVKFDFDGLYLGSFAADKATQDKLDGVTSITIDDRDRVYALVHSQGKIVRCSIDGHFQTEFVVEPQIDRGMEDEMIYGSMCFAGGYLYVPISNVGTVNRLTSDGKLVSRFGIKGTLVGQLNFPVSVSVSEDGIIMVLDKHRFNVVCFSQDGKFLAEFGGKGVNPGWFYHPTWIAIDSRNQVYVGQIFNNRIQVLSIPDLVYQRQSEVTGHAAPAADSDKTIGITTDNPDSIRRWFGKDNTYAFDCVEDDILHTDSKINNRIPYNPLSLAFTESVGGIYNA